VKIEMTNKIVILGIAILAVGLIALPETLALFADQHSWYGIDQGNATGQYGVPCMKCHVDVQQQIDGANNAVHLNTGCEECHVVSQLAKGDKVGGNGTIHAAAAPACLDCHGNNSVDSSTYFYGGAIDATSILVGTNKAHKDFVQQASADQLLTGANEACVGCHTHVSVDISWNKPTNLSFNAKVNTTGYWTVDNFAATGSKFTNVTADGNGVGSVTP